MNSSLEAKFNTNTTLDFELIFISLINRNVARIHYYFQSFGYLFIIPLALANNFQILYSLITSPTLNILISGTPRIYYISRSIADLGVILSLHLAYFLGLFDIIQFSKKTFYFVGKLKQLFFLIKSKY